MGALFLVCSALAVMGATLMVARRHPVYGLLFLLLSFVGVAGVFYSLSATFIAVSQVLVYAGAIAVLFLFVLMFVNLRRAGEDTLPTRVGSLSEYDPASVQEPTVHESSVWTGRLGAGVFAVTLLVILMWVIYGLPEAWDKPFGPLPRAFDADGKPDPSAIAGHAGLTTEGLGYFGSVKDFGQVMIRDYWLHFEVVGLVVLIGVMGAVILGKKITAIERAGGRPNATAAVSHGDGGH